MTILRAERVVVAADLEGARVPVVRDLSFRLDEGKVLGLVGESGAGKSMIGRAIANLLPPRFATVEGTLRFLGADLVAMDADKRRALLGRDIAFIPQEPRAALNPVYTIGHQFDEHLARLGVASGRERRGLARDHLAAVHLRDPEHLLEAYPHQLSGGMCQRVLIAMAFASDPKLVVADEPTTALDVTIQARIVDLLSEMRRTHGTSVLLITHDLRLAARVCDDILVLYAGRPAEYGPARAVFERPAHPYTRCLQLASPPLDGPRRKLQSLPEHMPTLRALAALQGCRFAPRCPTRIETCSREPALLDRGHDHVVACHRAEADLALSPEIEHPGPARRISAPVVKVESVGKVYPGPRRWLGRAPDVVALADVSFEIGRDEFVGLVGESGSGKSTLAKILLGLEAPTTGKASVAGIDVTDPSATAREARITAIQMVFQDPQSALNPRRRVADIVTQAMIAGRRRASWEERLAKTKTILAEVGMPADLALRYPAELSGGQRQRVNIARALCSAPSVLVADEIVSGLDVSVQAQLLNLLGRLRAELGFAMLFISHDLSVVRHLCDRVLVLEKGRVVESGPTEGVFASPASPYARALLRAVPPDDLATPWRPFAEAEDAAA
ncbi:MAG: ABC transporter ATP-binding protein [Alphaproteobacteria bacterium]|nr:ABC transporter ATP-binding protein [Alphaproteobacteria bacterium]